MRIVIDLQGAQTSGSRLRGIGRYSMGLTKGILRHRGPHEVLIALSDQFPETIEPIRQELADYLPAVNIVVWQCLSPTAQCHPGNDARRLAAEALRESFLASLQPDFVLVTSLFEGFGDDAVTSVGTLTHAFPTAVVLYDLIPLIHEAIYLENPAVRAWYSGKVNHLRRSDLLLAISESSRDEAVKYLGFDTNDCVAISTAGDEQYRPLDLTADQERGLRARYGLNKPFVMYTGGIDHRKNIEGLIRAFALLPQEAGAGHQLAIVCSAHEVDRERLRALAEASGLSSHQLVMTGFVPDQDLLMLYNLCKVFVFPSWHEGFGLPVLEAMMCGRPVIGSNCTSVPEVIGREDALFDPRNDNDIARLLHHVLTADDFRADLQAFGLLRSREFSWDHVAKRALTALAACHATRSAKLAMSPQPRRRPRLAFLSPLPPERSGISDYSADLLPELDRHYEIELITDQADISWPRIRASCRVRSVAWFREHWREFDRILYQFGNSHFHEHMFDLIQETGGVMVLHDFFLSGIVAYMELAGGRKDYLTDGLIESHGLDAVVQRYLSSGLDEVRNQYPCNLGPLQYADGVIVHSPVSIRLAREWLPDSTGQDWAMVPLLRNIKHGDRAAARQTLGIRDHEFLACSFGHLGETKLSHTLLAAWTQTSTCIAGKAKLVFVGQCPESEYGQHLKLAVETAPPGAVEITGWADAHVYWLYLCAADLAIQLRTLSRGETSAAVLDCMGHGIPTIVNANGSMADLPDSAVFKLSDEFTGTQLSAAIDDLAGNERERRRMGELAMTTVAVQHQPRRCAQAYRNEVERAYAVRQRRDDLSKTIRALGDALAVGDLQQVVQSWAWNEPARPRFSRLLVDITGLTRSEPGCDHAVASALFDLWLQAPPSGRRLEPLYVREGESHYRYARRFAMRRLGHDLQDLAEAHAEPAAGDVWLSLAPSLSTQVASADWLLKMHRAGVRMRTLMSPSLLANAVADHDGDGEAVGAAWLDLCAEGESIHCTDPATASALQDWLSTSPVQRSVPLRLNWFDPSLPDEGLHSLATQLLSSEGRTTWSPGKAFRYRGTDKRLSTQVGSRRSGSIRTTGQSGLLVYGPYAHLSRGQYEVRLHLRVRKSLAGVWLDATTKGGSLRLAHMALDQCGDAVNKSRLIVSQRVVLEQGSTDFEVRLFVSAHAELQLDLLEIMSLPNEQSTLTEETQETIA